MTKNEAQQLALAYLESQHVSEPVAFYDDQCLTKPYGWILFYNSKRFIETGNILYAFAGNGPLVVLDATGEVVALPSNQGPEESIQEFERVRAL
jgi:hypothetical protein